MPLFLIERRLPGAGGLSAGTLHDLAKRSNGVLRELGPEIQWVESYVVDDAIHCVYRAPDEDVIRAHARLGGFPVDAVRPIRAVIDPGTGE